MVLSKRNILWGFTINFKIVVGDKHIFFFQKWKNALFNHVYYKIEMIGKTKWNTYIILDILNLEN